MRLFLWGISNTLRTRIETAAFLLDERYITGYIDRDSKWKNGKYNGKMVILPSEIEKHIDEFDFIMITAPKYRDEILDQAEQMEALSGKVIPYEFLNPIYDEAFNRVFSRVFTSERIRIIKNWYVFEEDRCMLFSVENEIGNILCLKILPRGIFGSQYKDRECTIIDVQNDSEVFRGALDGESCVELPIMNDYMVFKVRISGLNSGFISASVKEGTIRKQFNSIKDNVTRDRYQKELSRLYDNKFHEFDYEFLTKVNEWTDFRILDVGANMGQSSMTFLSTTNMDVVAFEPHAGYTEALTLLHEKYGERFHFFTYGIGNVEGSMDFFLPKFEISVSQESSFNREKAISHIEDVIGVKVTENNFDEYVEKKKVRIYPLDKLIKLEGKPIFFVKIDAETYELQVIEGMSEIIKKYKPFILLEYNTSEVVDQILSLVNEIEKYKLMHWDYMNGCFTKENLHLSINYFLIPENNQFVRIDNEGLIRQ